MRRLRFYRLCATLASTSVVAATLTIAVGAGSAGPAAAAGASCTFNGVAANGLVTGVTPGGSVAVVCTGLPKSTAIVLVEASPLAGILPSSDSEDEADTGALGIFKSTKSGTLPPNTEFKVPSPFTADDPDAACPLSVAQVNAGLVGCVLAVADFAGTSFGTASLQYTTQASPQQPTLALDPTSACAGDQVTVEDGTGPGNWWGNADSAVKLSTSDITIDGIHTGSTTAAISAAQYSITTNSGKVTPGPFVPPMLSGTFTVPSGVVGNHSVTVTEPNTTPLPGAISASASLDVLSSTALAVSSISPNRGPQAGGTPVTISGCNFTGATAVMFGTQAAESFHVNSDTSITAVSPPGKGTVDIVVVGPSGRSTATSASAFTYGFQGYDLVGGDGGTFSFGDAHNYGSLPGLGIKPAEPIAGIAATSDAKGYWLAGADGGTFAFGDAHNYGSLPGLGIKPAAPIVGIAPTSDGKGYWLVGSDGGTFAFGDADNYGSLPGRGIKPAEPIVGIAPTSDGKGYWLVGADGGTFAFGDAHSYGSLPGLGIKPAKPIVGIISPDSGGYWLVGADGGAFAFGDARYFGSLGRVHLAAAISGGSLA
ncbi:MAG: IPT/TIG domain-containing protein [Acidimicrobiales bacterium]